MINRCENKILHAEYKLTIPIWPYYWWQYSVLFQIWKALFSLENWI